jgi:hypothetical protein
MWKISSFPHSDACLSTAWDLTGKITKVKEHWESSWSGTA